MTAVGLTPIALAYGIAPAATMRWLFDIDATGLDARHIFRAFMGLYLALSCFWIAGALVSRTRGARATVRAAVPPRAASAARVGIARWPYGPS